MIRSPQLPSSCSGRRAKHLLSTPDLYLEHSSSCELPHMGQATSGETCGAPFRPQGLRVCSGGGCVGCLCVRTVVLITACLCIYAQSVRTLIQPLHLHFKLVVFVSTSLFKLENMPASRCLRHSRLCSSNITFTPNGIAEGTQHKQRKLIHLTKCAVAE